MRLRSSPPRVAWPAVGVLCLVAHTSNASAQTVDRAHSIFFGVTAGGGVAWVDHPDVSPGARAGVIWDVVFGWGLSRHVAFALALTTWQTSPLGTPYHLHTLAPRLELTPGGGDGLYLMGALGLAMTDGDVRKAAGFGATLAVGYRLALTHGITVQAELGAHAHTDVLKGEGAALEPYVGLQFRLYGRTRRRGPS